MDKTIKALHEIADALSEISQQIYDNIGVFIDIDPVYKAISEIEKE